MMKYNKLLRKVTAFALCAFLMLSIAGCSSGGETETADPTAEVTTEAASVTGETEEVSPDEVVALRIYDSSIENVLYTATWADTEVTDAFQQLVDNYIGVDGERLDEANYVVEYVGYDEYSTRWYDFWFEEDGTIQFAQNRIRSMSFDGSGTRQTNVMTVDEFYSITGITPEE